MLAYSAMFTPPCREVREVIHNFEHLDVVNLPDKKPVRGEQGGHAGIWGRLLFAHSCEVDLSCLKPLEEALKD